ncbi:MAG TPA: hypothetical protein VFV93_03345 [Thermomicrobiales bacterium]|nr:hypothetical protein [Thermomicrobiales bacterium]
MNATAMVELSDGSVAIVDSEDLALVSGFDWSLPSSTSSRYPVGYQGRTGGPSAAVYLHRLIAHAGPEDIVYHRNHDTLDNRRENLVVMARMIAPGYLPLDSTDSLMAD